MRDPNYVPQGMTDRTVTALSSMEARLRGVESRGSAPGRERLIVGDGTTTSFEIRHGLNDDEAPVRFLTLPERGDLPAGQARVSERSPNRLSVQFTVAPAAGSVLIVVG